MTQVCPTLQTFSHEMNLPRENTEAAHGSSRGVVAGLCTEFIQLPSPQRKHHGNILKHSPMKIRIAKLPVNATQGPTYSTKKEMAEHKG